MDCSNRNVQQLPRTKSDRVTSEKAEEEEDINDCSSTDRDLVVIALQRGAGGWKRISYLTGRYTTLRAKSRQGWATERAREPPAAAAQLGHSSGSGVRSLTLPLAAAISRTLQIEWRLLDTRLIPLKTSNGQKLHQQPPSILRAAVLTCLHGRQASPSHMHPLARTRTHTAARLSSVFVGGSRQSSRALYFPLSFSRLVKAARSALNATGGGNFYPFSMGGEGITRWLQAQAVMKNLSNNGRSPLK